MNALPKKRPFDDESETPNSKRLRVALASPGSCPALPSMIGNKPHHKLPDAAAVRELAVPRNEFQHQPLDKAMSQIRVVAIGRRQSHTDQIECRLHQVSLNDKPVYTALSYAWGDQDQKHPILINDQAFYINANLWQILNQFSLGENHSNTSLWIDALCIDQNSISEKNHQVGMMSMIYTSAQSVRVWLGSGDANSNAALSFIPRLLQPGLMGSGDDWQHDYGFIALASLLSRDYWKRLWIAQEVALAKDIEVVAGDRSIDWQSLADAVNVFCSWEESIKSAFRSDPRYAGHEDQLEHFIHSPAATLLRIRDSTFLRDRRGARLAPRLTLERLVHDFAWAKCSDPRDRIYALLGLARKNAPPSSQKKYHSCTVDPVALETDNVQVNYGSSTLATYSQFTDQCIRTSGSLDIICRPWADLPKKKWRKGLIDPDLHVQVPSWIPVSESLPFTNHGSKGAVRVQGDCFVGKPAEPPYNAANGFEAKVRFGVDTLSNKVNGSLFAKGLEIATIEKVSTRMGDGIVHLECLQMIQDLKGHIAGRFGCPTESLWRILCANRDAEGKAVSSCYNYAMRDLFHNKPPDFAIDTVTLLDEYRDLNREPHVIKLLERIQSVVWNRRVLTATTSSSALIDTAIDEILVGLAPTKAKAGDKIVILFGGSAPMILRPHCEDGKEVCYELIGDAYVHGIMDGEVIEALDLPQIEGLRHEFEIW